MPYTPDHQKLHQSGFCLSNSYPAATSYLRLRDGEELVIVVYHARQSVKLKDGDCQRMEFNCPDESFFDLLLTATGFSAA